VLSGNIDNTLTLWDVATGTLLRTFKAGEPAGLNRTRDNSSGPYQAQGLNEPVRAVAFSPDGRTVLSGSDDYTLKSWDVATGKLIRTFEGHSGWVESVSFTPQENDRISQRLKTVAYDLSNRQHRHREDRAWNTPHPEPEGERDDDEDGIEGEPSGQEHPESKVRGIMSAALCGRSA
jgi:WD40 repeat protein